MKQQETKLTYLNTKFIIFRKTWGNSQKTHGKDKVEMMRRKIKIWKIENDLTYGSLCPQRRYYNTWNRKKYLLIWKKRKKGLYQEIERAPWALGKSDTKCLTLRCISMNLPHFRIKEKGLTKVIHLQCRCLGWVGGDAENQAVFNARRW